MKLKWQLVRDGEVIFEMPLSPTNATREKVTRELDVFEEHFSRFSKIFNALSNETRLMMMKRLLEERNRTINFSDFMRDLDLNPKLVWENTKKLRKGGLLNKIGRGRYQCSAFGEAGFIMINLSLKRLIDTLEDVDPF